MKDQRPVNLKLTSIHFPITAIVSILHRLSGLLLIVLIPCALWALAKVMATEASFYSLLQWLDQAGWLRCLIWLLLAALLYHITAGIRHVLMDMGVGESLRAGRLGARLVLLIWLVLVVLLGIIFYG